MAELQAGEGKEEKGKKKEEGGNDGEEGEGVRRLPQRTNSQRAEREEERRSRRALFQSVSTSNLNQQVIAITITVTRSMIMISQVPQPTCSRAIVALLRGGVWINDSREFEFHNHNTTPTHPP